MIPWWVYLLALGFIFSGAIWYEYRRNNRSTPTQAAVEDQQPGKGYEKKYEVRSYWGQTGNPFADAVFFALYGKVEREIVTHEGKAKELPCPQHLKSKLVRNKS